MVLKKKHKKCFGIDSDLILLYNGTHSIDNPSSQTITSIDLRKINLRDTRFLISYPSAYKTLFSSIEKLGIIEPVILLEGSLPYIIVTGFKRIEAAKKLNLKKIPAIIMKLSTYEAFLISIHTNMHRGLNIIEKAHTVEKMLRMDVPKSDIYELMATLSLSAHEKVLANLIAIAGAEEALKRFIIKHTLSMKNIEYMLRFEKDERKMIMKALARVRFTEGYLREILEMLHLVRIKKGKLSTNAQELRIRLKKRVHPKLSSLEKQLEDIKKAAALPPALDIRVDPFFEKEYIDITIRMKDELESKELLGKLDDIFKKGYIRSILELTRGRVR